jgi:hypothetical protein
MGAMIRFPWCVTCSHRLRGVAWTCTIYPKGIPAQIRENAFAQECPCGHYAPPPRPDGPTDFDFNEEDYDTPEFLTKGAKMRK